MFSVDYLVSHQRLFTHGRGEVPRLGRRVHRRLGRAGETKRRTPARQRRSLRPGGGIPRRQVVRWPLWMDVSARISDATEGHPRCRRQRLSADPRRRIPPTPPPPDGPHPRAGRNNGHSRSRHERQ